MTAPPGPKTNAYQRRLILLAGLMLGAVVLLGGRHAWLSVAHGTAHHDQALRALRDQRYLPTWRGQILDAEGRVLARDVTGYAIEARYEFITGQTIREDAMALAREATGAATWRALGSAARERLADGFVETARASHQVVLEWLAASGDLDRIELQERFDRITQRVHAMRADVRHRQREVWLKATGPDADPDDFRPTPIREERAFHPIVDVIDRQRAFRLRAVLHDAGLESRVRVVDARSRERPWRQRIVEVDGSTLPRPLAFDGTVPIEVVGIADHLLGSMRPVYREDVERRPFRRADGTVDLGGYQSIDDRTGSTGIERVHESTLRGTRGVRRESFDTGEIDLVPPAPGADLALTLDIELQARIQAVLHPSLGLTRVQPWHGNTLSDFGGDGRPLRVGIAVVEIETGEIRALVTGPSLAESREPGRTPDDDPRFREVRWSQGELAAGGAVVPGSTIKPLVLAAAMAEGVCDPSEGILCTGHYFDSAPNVARCWIHRPPSFATHGELDGPEALARSCNIYYHALAERLNPYRFGSWMDHFGIGTVPHAELSWSVPATPDVPAHHRGAVAGRGVDPVAIANSDARRFRTIMLGTGQESITWSPLQAAQAYATLARGGLDIDPTIVPPAQRLESQDAVQLPIPAAAAEAALEGLRQSANEPWGTGHALVYRTPGSDGTIIRNSEPIFTVRGVRIWGKTGSAQESARLGFPADPSAGEAEAAGDGAAANDSEADANAGDGGDGGGDEPQWTYTPVTLSHAWFVGLVGPEDQDQPMYAVSVVVEWGGSGGRCAGPIANQVLLALQRTGRLPGGDRLEPLDVREDERARFEPFVGEEFTP